MERITSLPPTVQLALLGLASLLIYTLVSFITLSAKRRSLQQQHGALPAAHLPQWDRPFGIGLFRNNLIALKEKRILEQAARRFDMVGSDTIEVCMLGRSAFFTREPEILKAIQATDYKNWSLGQRRINGFRPLLGVGIFTSDGADWAHSRTMLRPNFTRSQVADLGMFEVHIRDMIKRISQDGSTVDLSELFFLLTMDSATEFLFGESTQALTHGTADGFAEAFNRGQVHIAHASRWGIWMKLLPFLFHNAEFDHDRKFIHEFVDAFVEKGMRKRPQLLSEKNQGQTSEDRYVFIDELVRQTNDRVRIRSELLNVLLAGRDTTASLLSNSWFMLARRPDVWKKLQDEIAPLNGKLPSFEDIKEMKYLKAFLNESLRMHPVVPANSREAREDTVLPMGGGPDGKSPLFVPKGQIVAWSVWALHRRKDFYGEDAEEFRPERWLDDPVTGKKGLRVGWEYLPFNGGARICLGQQFALTEASYTTIRLLQTFKGIESRDSRPWIEGLSLTCTSANGTLVGLTPR